VLLLATSSASINKVVIALICKYCGEPIQDDPWTDSYCCECCMRKDRGFKSIGRHCIFCDNGCSMCHGTKVIFTWENSAGETYFDFFD